MKISNPFCLLSKFEWGLWLASVAVVTGSFLIGKQLSLLTLVASLIGITALIFVAKGNVLGQILTIVFSLLYSVISLQFQYYGEMITYLGMTTPMAALSVYSWLQHPFEQGKSEVKVAQLNKRQVARMIFFAVVVTAVFYYILRFFNTANLTFSTISITTSFVASYLTYCRSSAYALAYAANDIVLIVLWVLAAKQDTSYLPMVICFTMFFCNDMYGFFNWSRIRETQQLKQLCVTEAD